VPVVVKDNIDSLESDDEKREKIGEDFTEVISHAEVQERVDLLKWGLFKWKYHALVFH